MEFLKDYHCRILFLDSLNPYLNLAYEEYLFHQLKEKEYFLLLYKCRPSLIMGRFQNPWQEINTVKFSEEPIALIRRFSGGGTVYHDEENLNYSFLSYSDRWKQREHCDFISQALKNFGIQTIITDKFDILVETNTGTKKISGSAFKKSRNRYLHHGTLLINSNLENLRSYLAKSNKNIFSKAIASRPHSVMNLKELSKDISTSSVVKHLEQLFCQYSSEDICVESVSEVQMMSQAASYLEKLSSWENTWGETPKFVQEVKYQFSWSEGSVQIEVVKGFIDKIDLDDGFFHPDIVDKINQDAHGLKFESQIVLQLFRKQANEDDVYGVQLKEVGDFLAKELR